MQCDRASCDLQIHGSSYARSTRQSPSQKPKRAIVRKQTPSEGVLNSGDHYRPVSSLTRVKGPWRRVCTGLRKRPCAFLIWHCNVKRPLYRVLNDSCTVTPYGVHLFFSTSAVTGMRTKHTGGALWKPSRGARLTPDGLGHLSSRPRGRRHAVSESDCAQARALI